MSESNTPPTNVSTEAWTDEQFLEARERDLSERTANAWAVVVAALASLTLAALLTSAKLVEIAERQPLGVWRDRQVSVADRVDRFANFFSLNRPYDFIIDIRGSGNTAGRKINTIDEVVSTTTGPVTTSTTVPAVVPDASLSTTTTSPATTTTASPYPLRTVDDTDPLRVFAAGDSQMEFLSQALSTESGDRALDVEAEFQISTGLSRPDYFNWPAELASVIGSSDPEAVVLFMGANDHQDMATSSGDRLVRDSAEWQTEWARRLALTFDLLEMPGRQVFWVTQPPMRDARLNDGMSTLNALAAEVVSARDFVTAIDIWPMFGGESGFSSRVVGPDGSSTSARVSDGVHLNRTAASWVAEMIFESFDGTWRFSQ